MSISGNGCLSLVPETHIIISTWDPIRTIYLGADHLQVTGTCKWVIYLGFLSGVPFLHKVFGFHYSAVCTHRVVYTFIKVPIASVYIIDKTDKMNPCSRVLGSAAMAPGTYHAAALETWWLQVSAKILDQTPYYTRESLSGQITS